MEALLYLGVNPSQHGLVNAAVVAATTSTSSSAYPRMMLSESPCVSCTQPIPGFHIYPQGSLFSGEYSSEVSIMAPSTPASVTIELNTASVARGSSSGGMRKRKCEMRADMLTGTRNLFDGIPTTVDNDTTNHFLENMILEGAPAAGAYDPNGTQSQDGRAPFTQATNDLHDAFMQDQVGLDGFPLNHEFPEDYRLHEEEDDMDIDGEPLFEEELANQTAAGGKPKRKSKRTKAYTSAEDKLLCECWRDIGQELKISAEKKWSALWTHVHREFHERKKFPPYQMQSKRGWVSLSKRWRVIQQECNKFCATYESIKARPMSGLGMQDMHDSKAFHLAHCWTIINEEEKFKAQYATLLARGGKEAVQDHGDGKKARLRGKTNSKKEDMRDAVSIALLKKVEGMISMKDLREEKSRQEKEEQMHSFMEIQRRRLEMDAKRQAKMLELEEAKQAKMLEIEATNARIKAKEVALASMRTGAEIMKVDLNTVLLRKRLWFEKMQAEMLKFDQL
ncbi:DNA repair protein rhp54 [Hordeum vulgare]|nr:DNA repair protein rhp54 [Hordeum vulgare]